MANDSADPLYPTFLEEDFTFLRERVEELADQNQLLLFIQDKAQAVISDWRALKARKPELRLADYHALDRSMQELDEIMTIVDPAIEDDTN